MNGRRERKQDEAEARRDVPRGERAEQPSQQERDDDKLDAVLRDCPL